MKKVVAMVMVLVMCLVGGTSAYANGGVAPCFNNTHVLSNSIRIADDGTARISVYCEGDDEVYQIRAFTYVAIKEGNSWKNIYVTPTSKCWADSTTETSMLASHTVKLTQRGDYRVYTSFCVYGARPTDLFNAMAYDTY